jgi:hypothetical protein
VWREQVEDALSPPGHGVSACSGRIPIPTSRAGIRRGRQPAGHADHDDQRRPHTFQGHGRRAGRTGLAPAGADEQGLGRSHAPASDLSPGSILLHRLVQKGTNGFVLEVDRGDDAHLRR